MAPAPFYDFGDLPAPYKTLINDDDVSQTGPQHGYVKNLRLGESGAEELNGYKDGSDDTTDDATHATQDESDDGVFIHSTAITDLADLTTDKLLQGKKLTATKDAFLNIRVVDIDNIGGKLYGWVDWNNDGDFGDAGETLANEMLDDGQGDDVAAGDGIINIKVTPPINISSGFTGVRFRYSAIAGLTPTGLAANGEVEDYWVELEGPFEPVLPTAHCSSHYYQWNIDNPSNSTDEEHQGTAFADMNWFFDANNLPIRAGDPVAPSGGSNLLYHADVLPNLSDTSGINGETSLVITRLEYAPNTAVTLNAYDKGRSESHIMAVLDGDGNLLTRLPATGEILSSSDAAAQTPQRSDHTLSFTTPANGVVYFYNWVADFTAAMSRIYPVCMDMSDAQQGVYPLASHGVRPHVPLQIGDTVSIEKQGFTTPTNATGDASDDGVFVGVEHADRLLQGKTLVEGHTTQLRVKVQGAGKLSAWIDFDGDNAFNNATEKVAADLLDDGSGDDIAANDGYIDFKITPSSSTVTGSSIARFRYTTATAVNPSGAAVDGEVEDYQIELVGNDTVSAFTCEPGFYQLGDQLFRKLDPVTASYQNIGSTTITKTSIAYNSLNNAIYAYQNDTGEISIFSADGTKTILGTVFVKGTSDLLGLPTNAAAIDKDGFMWLHSQQDNYQLIYHKVNLDTLEVEGVSFTFSGAGSAFRYLADIAYLKDNTGSSNRLYGRNDNTLQIIDLDTKTISQKALSGDLATGIYGAIWTDKNGRVFAYHNDTGGLYEISNFDTATPTSTLINITKKVGGNDGASCPLAAAPFYDYGDLPAPYNTLLNEASPSTTAPQHAIDNGLRLGTLVNDELNGYKDGSDDGDDSAYVAGLARADDSDDGVFLDAAKTTSLQEQTLVSTVPYTLHIPFVNTTGSTAKLSAWIDWNRDGDFSDSTNGTSENIALNIMDVTDGATDNKFTLTITPPLGLSNGFTGVRFRLSTDNIGSPNGVLGDGEVEDYWVQILDQIDHGDAPDSYGDASHVMLQTNTTTPAAISGIYMGVNPPDMEAVPLNAANGGADGTGDDADVTTNDEDGITSLPTLYASDSRYSVDVKVTNTTGASAYLVAWLDFDASGTFEADEATQLTVPSGATHSTVTLNWNSLPANAVINSSQTTFLRVRLTTDTSILTGDVSTSKADTLASDGEVEDYLITLLPDTLSLSGHVFIDNDVDGSYDSNTDSGHKDVLVVLAGTDAQANNVCVGTYSKSDGSFVFSNIPTGNYTVYETTDTSGACNTALANVPAGYLITTTSPKHENLVLSTANITGLDFGHVIDFNTGTAGLSYFKASQQSSVNAGESVSYTHTFTAPTQGSVSFVGSLVGNNWGSLLAQDNNCDGFLSNAERSTALTALTVSAGQDVCLVAEVTAPSSAADGEQSTLGIDATFSYGGVLTTQPATTLTLTDITTAKASTSPAGGLDLSLLQEVRNLSDSPSVFSSTVNQALPGDQLEYRITYRNPSSVDMDYLVINDMLPEYTEFVSAVCDPAPAGLTCSAPTSAPNGALQWDFTGVLHAGTQGSVRFTVEIQ